MFKKITDNKYVRGAIIGVAISSIPFIVGIKKSYVKGYIDGVEIKEQIYELQEGIERIKNEIKELKKNKEMLENKIEEFNII